MAVERCAELSIVAQNHCPPLGALHVDYEDFLERIWLVDGFGEGLWS